MSAVLGVRVCASEYMLFGARDYDGAAEAAFLILREKRNFNLYNVCEFAEPAANRTPGCGLAGRCREAPAISVGEERLL